MTKLTDDADSLLTDGERRAKRLAAVRRGIDEEAKRLDQRINTAGGGPIVDQRRLDPLAPVPLIRETPIDVTYTRTDDGGTLRSDVPMLPDAYGADLVAGLDEILRTPREPNDQARQLATWLLGNYKIERLP